VKTDLLAPADLRVVGSRATIAGAGQFSLKAMGTGKLPDGALVYVQSVKAYFQLNRGSSAAPDYISVVPAALGNGNWHRLESNFADPSPWVEQSDWYIDAIGGNDESDGATSATALATHAEFERRMGKLPTVSVPIHVTLLTSLSETIRLRYRVSGDAAYVHWKGTPQSVLLSGAPTAFTVPANNVEGLLTDATQDFTSAVGRRIRFTNTGLNTDPKTFIGRLRGGPTVVRCVDPIYYTSYWSGLNTIDPVGAPYQIEEQCSVWGFDIQVDRDNTGTANETSLVGAVLEDLNLAGCPGSVAHTAYAPSEGGKILLYACAVGANCNVYGPARSEWVACSSRDGTGAAGLCNCEELSFLCHHHSGGGLNIGFGSYVTLNSNQLDEYPLGFQPGSSAVILGTGLYDSLGSGLGLSPGATVLVQRLWGEGHSGPGVTVSGTMQYVNKPTVTGDTPGVNDANVGGVDRSWAQIPYVNANNLARITLAV